MAAGGSGADRDADELSPPAPVAGEDDDVKAAMDATKVRTAGGGRDGAVRNSSEAAELLADTSLQVDLPSKADIAAARRGELLPGVAQSPHAEAVLAMVNQLNATGALRRHRDFVAVRAHVIRRLTAARASSTFNEDGTGTGDRRHEGCVEFLRTHELPTDHIYRVPCVPRNASGLVSVRHAPFGVIATFRHRALEPAMAAAVAHSADPGTTLAPVAGTASSASLRSAATVVGKVGTPVRVAVEMSGQMRTYRRCAGQARSTLLEPNGALLFLATYPDVGDKRFGERQQKEQDDEADVSELRALYGADHLAAAYLVDLPTVRARLMRGFPTLFVLKQWSWMIYQLFMMELAHNTTAAHVGLITRHESFGSVPYVDHTETFVDGDGDAADPGRSWGAFDVYVRLRPDLWVMGRVRFVRPPTSAAPANTTSVSTAPLLMHFDCGGEAYPAVEFNQSVVLRSPHHPIFLWPWDPLSDHSAIGQPPAMNAFLRLFSDTVHRDPAAQERRVFYHGNTAEKLWGEHAGRQGLLVKRVPGWHLMLRNAAKFTNATLHASEFKKKLISIIFGATDPHVGCPAIDNCNTVLTHKPKKKLGGGKKVFAKPGFTGRDCG